MESISDSRGTPLRTIFPTAIKRAARIGSAEFLLPEISILPLSRFPPRMMKLSIGRPSIGPRPENASREKRVTGRAPHSAVQSFGLSASPLADDQLPIIDAR